MNIETIKEDDLIKKKIRNSLIDAKNMNITSIINKKRNELNNLKTYENLRSISE